LAPTSLPTIVKDHEKRMVSGREHSLVVSVYPWPQQILRIYGAWYRRILYVQL